jgi:PAS domain S-box-containing protein
MKTILLVADDADLRATMCTTLQNAHYDITQAPSASRAIEIAQQEPPDLIVCDMSMPHGAGLDLLTTLGDNPDTENIPLLLITGEKAHPSSPFASTVATDLLCKPFSGSDLVAAVNTRLRTRATFDDARRRNNQRLLTVVESTAALVALIDPLDYRLSYLNKTGCNMLELEPPATAVGAHFMSFFPEGEDRTAIEIGLSQAAVQGHWARQVTLLGHHGRRTDAELDLQAHRAPNGELDYYELTARDITRQKATEAQLHLLSRAIEQVPTSIIITDAAGCIKYVNPRFSRITGYTAAEVIGLNPRILKSGNTPPEVYTALWKAITHGREWRGTLQNRRKNGELFWEQATISSVIDEHGRTSHYISFKEDITASHAPERSGGCV